MNNSQKTFLFCTALIAFAVVTRILSIENHWYNFASMGALSLFSGVMFKGRGYAFALPLAAMLVTDVYLQATSGTGFYGISQIFVYASVILIAAMAKFMKKVNVINVLGFSVASSVLFFLVSNTGTWFSGFFPTAKIPAMYPTNAAGLLTCLEMGIPFYKNTLVSDVAFSAVLFGAVSVFQSILNKSTVVKAA